MSRRAQETTGSCRFCGAPLEHLVVDLGVQPLANSYLSAQQLDLPESSYPLRAFVCEHCLLVQLEDFTRREDIFNDTYAYFASYSESWLAHARRYVDDVVPRLGLDEHSFVVELASNDGYLLRNFVERGIPVLGIEPTTNTAEVAIGLGIPTETVFFGCDTARRLTAEGKTPDLIIGNNVLAHVPDLNDFVGGMKILLAPGGTITMEFPHLLNLVTQHQFDTIYHEHFSYFSMLVVRDVFRRHGMEVFDVEELPTHGGSLRIFARHLDSEAAAADRVTALVEREREVGLDRPSTYDRVAKEASEVRRGLLDFLRGAQADGKQVAAYGAPAKGNTLLNYCEVTTDLVGFTVDRSPHKQALFLPGSRIPIRSPEYLVDQRPDYVLILPWNLKDEIVSQMQEVRAWGGHFVVPIPELTVLD